MSLTAIWSLIRGARWVQAVLDWPSWAKYAALGAVLVLVGWLWHQHAVATAYDKGYTAGKAACEAAHDEATRKLNIELDRLREATRKDAERLSQVIADRLKLERRLSNEAQSDPAAGGACITPDGLRRLDTIR